MLPSFTRNWLSKAGRTDFPVPYNRFDLWTIVLTVPVFVLWIAQPEGTPTVIAACLAAVLHSVRLWRWGGWKTSAEPLVMVLHVAYAFVPIGFVAVALLDLSSAIHVFTVGTVSAMMLAVMTRATRGHTGRELTASYTTCLSYGAIFLCALTRPLATLIPEHMVAVYSVAAALWIGAFALYLIEYAPMLIFRRKPSARAA